MNNKLRVVELCKAKGITQDELAKRIGISRIAMSKCINGNPTIGNLERIAGELNVPVWQLFRGYKESFIAMVKSGDSFICTSDINDLQTFIDTIKGKEGIIPPNP